MSKERARRRTEREREAAVRRAARAAAAERRERRQARRRTLHAATVGRVPLPASGRGSSGQPLGTLARRRRQQTTALVVVLVLVNLVVWVVRGDWPAVLGAAVVSVLVYPVLKVLLFDRR